MAALNFDDAPTQTSQSGVLNFDEAPLAKLDLTYAKGAPATPDYSASVLSTRLQPHPLANPAPMLGGTAEGIFGGVVGLPGEIESGLRAASHLPWPLGLGSSSQVSSSPLLPTSSGIENTLFGQPSSKDVAQGRALGELMSLPAAVATTEGAAAIPGVAGKIVRPILNIPKAARGTEATKAAEAFRSQAKGFGESAIMSEKIKSAASEAAMASKQAEKAKYESQLDEAERAQQEIEQWNEIRKLQNRDVRSAPTDAELAEIRTDVTSKVRDRVREAEKKAREAGLNETEATAHAAEMQQKIVDADKAVDQIDEEFRSRPQMTAQEFGDRIQNAADKIQDKYIETRKKESGFDQVMDSSSPEPDVSTKPIQDYIKGAQQHLSMTSRAILGKYLDDLDSVVEVGEDHHVVPAISLRKAESLRKDLSTAINTKQVTLLGNAGKVSASEVIHHLKIIKSMLVKYAGREYPEYISALSRYQKLSRPLDLFQKKGALADVVSQNLTSDEFTMLKADVVGRVIKRANAGSPALTRLIAERSDLVDAARLHFNRELFGGETAPNAAKLAKFLRENQSALNQLGLFDEFSTLRGARAAGEKAVEDAKAEAEEAAGLAKEAKATRIGAEKEVVEQGHLRSAAVKRETSTGKDLKTSEDIAAEAGKRVTQAQSRLRQTATEAERGIRGKEQEMSQVEKQRQVAENLASDLRDRVSDLDSLPPKESVTKAQGLVSKLRNEGYMDEDDYKNAIDQIQIIRRQFGETARARKIIGRIVWLSGIAWVVKRYGADVIRDLVP